MRTGTVRLLVCVLAAGSVVLGPTASSAAPPTGLRVVGNQLTRDGHPFLMRGLNLVGALAGAGCTRADVVTAAAHLGPDEMTAMVAGWHANSVRLQVSQSALSDPVAGHVSAYLASVETVVAQARAAGLVVILSMQDQNLSCGPGHPLPSQATVTAWGHLAPVFAGDQDVAFELFNEPHDAPLPYNPAPGEFPGTGQWDQWLAGGTSPETNLGDDAVGHQQLVDDVRALGATNVLIADGLNKGGQLQGVPLLQDTLATPNVAYAVHPYYYVLGSTDWDFRFGDAATRVPVIATEWNYPTSKCGGTLQQTMAPGFLSYLATRGIGVLGQAGDIGIGTLLMSDWSWDPTDCGTPASGPGVDFAAATAATAAPRATRLTLTGDSGFTIGYPTVLTGSLQVAGVPAPDVPLTLTRTDPDGASTLLAPVSTDGTGGFRLADVPVAVGTSTYTVRYGGNAATASASAAFAVSVIPVLTFLSATGPASAPRAVPLTITGTLTGGDTATGLRPLTWTRTDLTGTVQLAPLTTDSAGGFAATDTPPAGGSVTYAFGFAGDSTHAGSTATVVVDVARLTPDLTVVVSKPVFGYGGAGTVTVHLGPTYTDRTVSLYEYVYGVPAPAWALVHTGLVNSSGNYVLSTNFYRHVAFRATFAGDARYASATSTTSTTSLARITTSITGYYATSGVYRLFHHSANPLVRALLSPARGAVGCMPFTVQALTGSVWKTVVTTTCVPVDAAGGASALPLSTHSLSVHYRVRASIATDTVNAATAGPWVYAEFLA